MSWSLTLKEKLDLFTRISPLMNFPKIGKKKNDILVDETKPKVNLQK